MITAKEIIAIYEAGIESGRDEAHSYDWGCSRRDHKFSELEEVLIWGDGILTGKEMDYDQKQAVWEAFKKEAGI